MYWGDKLIESKRFQYILTGAFWSTIVIALLILFMIANFIIKIAFLDYRFDDGELKPPIESATFYNVKVNEN